MVRDFYDLGQDAGGRHAGKPQTALLQPVLVVDVHLVAVAMALADHVLTIDLVRHGPWAEVRRIGAEPHRAAEVARRISLFDLVTLDPFGHQADHRILARSELRRRGAFEP